MVKMPSCALILIVSLMVCTGCSVKENREACPCRIMLDYSEVDTSVVRSADLFMRSDDGFFFTHELDAEDFEYGMEVPVPRGDINLSVWSGTDGLLTEDGMVIPVGEDCPEVYLHSSVVDADCEYAVERVNMRKNHCRMTVNLKNVAAVPKSLLVIGNTNGYDSGGVPSSGMFRYEMTISGGIGGLVVLPRQADDSLRLEVMDGSGVLRRFNIGEYILESGYDWNLPDLKDLVLDIDITVTDVKLMIQGWEKVYKFDVII